MAESAALPQEFCQPGRSSSSSTVQFWVCRQTVYTSVSSAKGGARALLASKCRRQRQRQRGRRRRRHPSLTRKTRTSTHSLSLSLSGDGERISSSRVLWCGCCCGLGTSGFFGLLVDSPSPIMSILTGFSCGVSADRKRPMWGLAAFRGAR